jgi:hypothetical protein
VKEEGITNKEKLKMEKIENKRLEGGYYQDISILLDRRYEHVKELKEKLVKVNKSIMKQLKNSPKI